MIPIEVYLKERKQSTGFTPAKPQVYNKYDLRFLKNNKKHLQGINSLLIQACYMLTNTHKLPEEKQLLFFNLLLKNIKIVFQLNLFYLSSAIGSPLRSKPKRFPCSDLRVSSGFATKRSIFPRTATWS